MIRPFDIYFHSVFTSQPTQHEGEFSMKRMSISLFVILMVVIGIASCGGGEQPAQQPEAFALQSAKTIPVDDALAYAAGQLEKSFDSLDDTAAFPFFVDKETGKWSTMDETWWSSGFFAGCLWLMYEDTGDEVWKTRADKWTRALENQQNATGDADVGYRMVNSYGNAWRVTGDEYYRGVLVKAAESLASRYDDTVCAVKAYDGLLGWEFPILIDHMMNIELMFLGVNAGGDPAWKDMCVKHSYKTAETTIRPDGSSIQVVDLDPTTGDKVLDATLCGLSGDSAWSRGQGEGIYGFAIACRETGNQDFMATAMILADYAMANMPEDFVPYWDYKDPAIPNVIRDASAASMIADGLLEMVSLLPDGADKQKYFTAAENILESLCSNYMTRGMDTVGIIDHAAFQGADKMGADTSLIFGDCNFISALLKYKRIKG